MNKKNKLISIIFVVILSTIFSYSLAFGVNAFFGNEIFVKLKLSNSIYPDSLYLKNTMIAFQSNFDLSEYKINSKCNTFSKIISKKDDIYLFELKFLDNKCEEKYFYLESQIGEKVERFNFNIISEYKLYSELVDYNTEKLEKLEKLLDKKRISLLSYSSFDKNGNIDYFDFLKKNRLLNELIYNKNLINLILEGRENKYMVPVLGKDLPTSVVKIPNSGRGYRADYTDGIHHGWDVGGEFGEQIVAIDSGVIVRVISDFDFSDLQNIVRGNNLSYDEKLKNLDILRGNQVWLKTTKGDVVFYSHLNDVYSNIEEGVIVRKGQPIGTIGISGVPDENYTDYHIHFPIHKNPYNKDMVGKYEIEDYMNWDWYYKGKSAQYILNNQSSLFETNNLVNK